MKIIAAAEMRRLEQAAMAQGVSGRELMERAGRGAAQEMLLLTERFPRRHRRRFVVLAGKGNNGGDGWVVARALHEAGCDTMLYSVCEPSELKDDACWHASQLPSGCPWQLCRGKLPTEALREGDVVVDALLGTGVKGAPRGIYADWIAAVNDSSLPVFALDIPSGVDADSGEGVLAVRADWTLTMGLPKSGLFQREGRLLCGTLRGIGIGLPKDVEATAVGWQGPDSAEAFGRREALALLERRPVDGHKNLFGHLLCLCNSADYSGAGYLCAEAALRCGAGLVTLAAPAGSRWREGPAALIQRRLGSADDGCFHGGMSADIESALSGKTAVVYGPGTGRDVRSRTVLARLLAFDGTATTALPLVVDADGLRQLAECQELLTGTEVPVVLTPHPGEMAALLRGFGLESCLDTAPAEQARCLAKRTGCTVVLKGRFTAVASCDGRTSLNLSGDVSLATAGSGDVLSGVIGALLANGRTPWEAARLGVYLHGLAAELRDGSARGLLADDLPRLLDTALCDLAPGL